MRNMSKSRSSRGSPSFMMSRPLIAIAVEGKNAVDVVRKTMGATNPQNAEPGTIRGDLAVDIGRNLIHGSDSPESAERELAIFFAEGELLGYQRERLSPGSLNPDELPACPPHLLQPVEVPLLLAEDVHHHVAEVEQHPAGLRGSLAVMERGAGLFHRFDEVARERVQLPYAARREHDHVVGERGDAPHVEQHDVGTLLVRRSVHGCARRCACVRGCAFARCQCGGIIGGAGGDREKDGASSFQRRLESRVTGQRMRGGAGCGMLSC